MRKQRKRWVVECVWSGYRREQAHVCHRRVVTNPEPYKKVSCVRFGDGTHMSVSVRQCTAREKVSEVRGYDELFQRLVHLGLTGSVSVDDLWKDK